ncbi:MAG TPA: nickel pincer cofactor biosynthesis protein LarB [Polyangia bacterium]|jgi:NCAIR mutase (PurE)-related protein|nr:nickel pincer cofactor biosynthesis protein LarB [Polyangia bacterium]
MDPERLRDLLESVAARRMPVDEAMRELRELPFRSLGFAHADTHRHLRTGFPEVILGEGKTAEQIAAILLELARGGSTVLATRVTPEKAAVVLAAVPEARHLPVPRAIVLGPMPAPDRGRGTIAVLSAGTADVPVAEEAALTAELGGNKVERLFDVGVAGLHRLLAHREIVERSEITIVVAGMEGALPSVVAGLFARPVIAVPTSVGYGASLQGIAALLAMLTSCAAGVSVVNIDNGFGAGRLAAMLNRKRET